MSSSAFRKDFEELTEPQVLEKYIGGMGIDIPALLEAIEAFDALKANPEDPFNPQPLETVKKFTELSGRNPNDPEDLERATELVLTTQKLLQEYRREKAAYLKEKERLRLN